MIELKSAYSDTEFAYPEKFTHGLIGKDIDDRTVYSSQYVRNLAKSVKAVNYRHEELNLSFDSKVVECHELEELFCEMNIRTLLIDTTSLGVPELALILKYVIKIKNIKIMMLYVEPDDYTAKVSDGLSQEEFGLSDEILGFEGSGIPTITMPIDEHRPKSFVFFLGFEGNRFLSALETYDLDSDETEVLFGVPAFKPGWELRSIRRNIQALTEQNYNGRIHYCGANDSAHALKVLRDLHKQKEDGFVYVVPIGTKPNSIAALIYASENTETVRILYDQPTKRRNRSKGVGRRHFYYIKEKS